MGGGGFENYCYIFVRVFQYWECLLFGFAIVLAYKAMVEQMDQNASFDSLFKSVCFLWKVL